MVQFGMLLTYPFFVVGNGETDEYGYETDRVRIKEFEGIIDYIGGNRYNDYMTIHQDATHVIITGFSPELYDLLDGDEALMIEDGNGTVYRVLLVDDVARQGHHLEIEVEDTMGLGRDVNVE